MASPNAYIYTVLFALPVALVIWTFSAMFVRPVPLMALAFLLLPLISVIIAAMLRNRIPRKIESSDNNVAGGMSGEISKRELRIASVVSLILIPLLLLCFLPLALRGQLSEDVWPTVMVFVCVGLLVSVSISVALMLASFLP